MLEAQRTAATVLAVDDEVDIVDGLRAFLEGALPGLEVLTATSGPKALEILGRRKVDLILTDYKMPGMTGLKFLEEAAKVAPTVPRILLTAYPDMDLALKALNQHHVVHFFIKPFEPAEVLDAVRALVDRSMSDAQRKAAFARSLEAMRRRAKPRE